MTSTYPATSGPPLEMAATLADILLVLLMGSITKSRICIITLLVTNLFEMDFSELFLTVVH